MRLRRPQNGSSPNRRRFAKTNESFARKRERPPSTPRSVETATPESNDDVAQDSQLTRTRRTLKFLFGTWGAVSRAVVLAVMLAFVVDYFNLTVEVPMINVTISGDETHKAKVAEPPTPYPLPPYPPMPYPFPQYPLPPYPPQVQMPGQVEVPPQVRVPVQEQRPIAPPA
ncbi:hypothetical protein [Lentzea sp. HUAS12]|uniref:hypothetical protein n=1 Tax=Lentzea sp. HUAS12 TaxID=2951806 RepID=UPI00209D7630|nr:hypothetical protein [Lentzea sp. HUAS12]USX56397.1 hypothetical protein ND450_20535 [Lentzea sp. HUAS12]